MSGPNGERKPRRPWSETVSSAASETETAAVIAALEQFVADTAPAPTAADATSAWQRAALEEGIAARQVTGYAWGHAPRR